MGLPYISIKDKKIALNFYSVGIAEKAGILQVPKLFIDHKQEGLTRTKWFYNHVNQGLQSM